LTTIAGFGSLMVARHAGILSFGLLLALAVTCHLVAVFTVLPLLLRIVRLDTVPTTPVGMTPTMRSD
jgi:predicted RND superfamily exporter protein